jgi:prevent-host-death family protein
MPNIKPISDLRNYGAVLRDVAIGAPVFLTKNGHGHYAVLDIDEYKEYEKMLVWRELIEKLDEGRRSGEENGWIPADDVKKRLEERYRDGDCIQKVEAE